MLLTTYLVEQHNMLVEKATSITKRRRGGNVQAQANAGGLMPWRIKLQDISKAHTIVFNGERDLLEIISLNASIRRMANSDSIQYDFADIEAYIEDNWMTNKPLIDYTVARALDDDDQHSTLSTVVFTDDVTTTLNFAKLDAKIPQERLPSNVVDTVYAREIELPHLNEMIRDLETAVNLLITSGGDVEDGLADNMEQKFGIKNALSA